MEKDKSIRSYTAEELEARRKRGESCTDWNKVDFITDEELEHLIADDEDEQDVAPDWTKAKLVIPKPRQSVHLRLDRDTIRFFKAQGKGHITRMQAVLKAYADAHKHEQRHS
jgi:uncharacterized protein (DUF4415 family)